MPENDVALIAHLMRRAGFGTTQQELEDYAAKGYDAVVDDLLSPERFPEVDDDLIWRYYDGYNENPNVSAGIWIYRMAAFVKLPASLVARKVASLFTSGDSG